MTGRGVGRPTFRIAIATASTVLLTGQAYFKETPEVERICEGEKPSYGRETETGFPNDRNVEYAPGDREYDRLAGFLPGPPDGWSAEPLTVAAFASHTIGCGLRAERKFTKDDQDLAIALMVAPVAEAMKADIAGGRVKDNPPINLLVHKGYAGFSSRDSVALVVGSTLISVQGAASEAVRRALLDRFDLDAVAALKP